MVPKSLSRQEVEQIILQEVFHFPYSFHAISNIFKLSFFLGHLAPDASFIDEAEQDATYFFFNVAPQFQSFNNGNWKALEYVTREMAEK